MKAFYILTLFAGFCSAQIPSYYNSVDFSQSPENIKSQLGALVRNTHLYQLSYTPQTWIALKNMDLNPENQENVLLIYGFDDSDALTINDRSRDKDLSCHTTECTGLWSREHVYPKSIGNFDEDSWPGSDVHSLRPADGDMNEFRFNSPFAPGSGNAHNVANYRFYPGDEWKGDVARMIMYMYLRYPDRCLPNYVGDDDNTWHADMPDIFLEWNAEDPASQFEMNRNDFIETEFQGNRNPFIDNPYLATLIWGGPMADNTWETLNISEMIKERFLVYPNPATDYIYYQGKNFKEILIYNINGVLVDRDVDLNDEKTKLPVNTGLYFIHFRSEEGVKTLKIFKK